MSEANGEPLRIAAAIVTDDDGRLLLVRKRGSLLFMQPGGKKEPGERGRDAMARELREELGVEIDARRAVLVGTFQAPAANEPGRHVDAEVFAVALSPPVRPGAEIEEARWVDPRNPGVPCAPLTRNLIARLLVDRQIQRGDALIAQEEDG